MTSSTQSEKRIGDYIDTLQEPPKSYESLQHTWEQLREMSARLAIPINDLDAGKETLT